MKQEGGEEVKTSKRKTSSPKSDLGSVRKVAKQAGVSTATVSRALNKPETVAPSTRKRILEAVEHFGYRPNGLGKNLVKGRSHLLGLVIPNIGTTLYGEMVKGIEDELSGTGLQVVLASTRDDHELERDAISGLLQHSVDTGIVINSLLSPSGVFHDLWVHISPESLEYTLRVELDNHAGARLAVRHLLEIGRRDVAHLAGTLREGREREQGWRDELLSAGLKPGRYEKGDYTLESGLHFGKTLLRMGLPDAVFVAGDLMAAGVLAAFNRAGVAVPSDVAVVGFDDAAYTGLLHPALTTIRQPAYQMGKKAAEFALLQLAGETLRSVIFEPELVTRSSTGGARASR